MRLCLRSVASEGRRPASERGKRSVCAIREHREHRARAACWAQQNGLGKDRKQVLSRYARGFTLIEVLLATVLLAAGLALAFATLRASTTMIGRGELIAQRNERMRAVEGFLRQRLASAQPIVFATDPTNLRQSRFAGESQRMRFVADLPDYLGRGGPYLHDLSIDADGRLLIGFSIVQAGDNRPLEEVAGAEPERLTDGMQAVRFRYRGLDRENKLGEWQDSWTNVEMLPLQVAVELQPDDGRHWPPVIVTLARSEGGAGGELPAEAL
jgi:general secretion pathway protein J